MSPESTADGQAGLSARILELAAELRREGVAIGTSEILDAFEVLGEISWTSQEDFREALAATLAKSQEDRRVFELVFDRYFFRAVERQAVQRDLREERFDDGEMRDMARLAIAAFGRQGEGSGVIGVDVQRIRRTLGLKADTGRELPDPET